MSYDKYIAYNHLLGVQDESGHVAEALRAGRAREGSCVHLYHLVLLKLGAGRRLLILVAQWRRLYRHIVLVHKLNNSQTNLFLAQI